MKAIGIFLAVCAAGMLLLTVAFGLTWMSNSNREVALRAQFEAQQKANESIFDRTWKIISQEAQIPVKYEEGFKSVMVDVMKARNPEGQGSLAKFLTEANVSYTPELYSKLMTTIEAQRTDFDRCQQKLLDVKREHDSLKNGFPGSFFLAGRSTLNAVIVTSDTTEKAFATGKHEPDPLFSNK